jgi:hypothetical protein
MRQDPATPEPLRRALVSPGGGTRWLGGVTAGLVRHTVEQDSIRLTCERTPGVCAAAIRFRARYASTHLWVRWGRAVASLSRHPPPAVCAHLTGPIAPAPTPDPNTEVIVSSASGPCFVTNSAKTCCCQTSSHACWAGVRWGRRRWSSCAPFATREVIGLMITREAGVTAAAQRLLGGSGHGPGLGPQRRRSTVVTVQSA